MAEVYINSNFPVKTKIFYAGELMDADGSVVAEIYDVTEDPAIVPLINPGTLITQLVAVKSESDAGTYQVVFPFSLTDRARKFKLKWTYAIESELVHHYSTVDVITPYIDIADAIEDLGFGSDPSDPNNKSYHDLIMAEKWARKTIEAYTGQQFYLYNDLHVVYGDHSDSLRLPFKISELHELYENDILLVDTINEINNWNYDTVISESGFGIRINRANMLDNTVYTANGMVPPSINDTYGGVFKNGSVYKIQGVYGWDVVPDEVNEACIYLMRDYFSKDKTWREKYLHSVQSFDWHFEYNTGAFVGTGNLYVDQILLPYVLTQMVVI
jgi:hypothetical protein